MQRFTRLLTLLLLFAWTNPMAAQQPQKMKPEPLPADTDWSAVDWKARLTAEQFRVTRGAGTERPFQNAYWDNKKGGKYHCVCCGLPLYSSETKYKSGTGWPSFYAPVDKTAITEKEDRKLFSVRIETVCTRCGAHLGHVFNDGPEPTGLRYCMNSAALEFVPSEEKEP